MSDAQIDARELLDEASQVVGSIPPEVMGLLRDLIDDSDWVAVRVVGYLRPVVGL